MQKLFIELSQSPDIDTFKRHLIDYAHALGFERVGAMVVLDRPEGRADGWTIHNAPDEYVEIFLAADLCRRDPVMQRLKLGNLPVAYQQDYYTEANEGALWEEQAPFGYKTGVAVVMHLPKGQHFVLGVDRSEHLPKDEMAVTALAAELQLLATYTFDVAFRLLVGPESKIPNAHLTPRERDVLAWTMEGKSAWEIGHICNISENTVIFHLRNVMRKFDVRTKHQAVVKAINAGLI